MDKRSALARLPGTYGFALFLRDLGLSDAEIAIRLELEEKVAANVLTIAEAKLQELLRSPDADQQAP